MLSELLQDKAALYVSGVMTAEQREQFELIVEFNDELREFAVGLAEVGTAMTLAALRRGGQEPSPATKARILDAVADQPQQTKPEALVMSGPDGLVKWINPSFSVMCGYTIEELRGEKLGPILQGEKTDRETAGRMRRAVHECRPCREIILNYHKNGAPYWVEIDITPIFGEAGEPLWLVAREREVADRAAA
jgi:PAS domain S-box-containing protein